jgi:hypothetical protein
MSAARAGLLSQLLALALSAGDGSNIAALAKRTFAALLRIGRDAATAELAATALGAARDAAAAGDAAAASARWLFAACWAALLIAPSPAEHAGSTVEASARVDASLSELASEGTAAATRTAAVPPTAADGCGGRSHSWSAAYEALISGGGAAGAAERLAHAALGAELRPVVWFHFLGVADALARGGGVGRCALHDHLLVALPRAQREALAPSALALGAACWAARPVMRLDAFGAWASRAALAGVALDASTASSAAGARSDYAYWWLQHLAHTHTAAAEAAEGAQQAAELVARTDDVADCAAPRRYAAAVVRVLQLMLLSDSESEQREWVRAHLKLARLVGRAGAAGGGALGSALCNALDDYIGLAAARLAELQASADGRGDADATAAAHERARGLERAHALADAFGPAAAGADGERRMIAAARNLALFSKAFFKAAVLPALVRLCCCAAANGGGGSTSLAPARREQLLGALVENGLASSEAVERLRAECATPTAGGPVAAPAVACASDDDEWSDALGALVRRARAPIAASPPRRALRRLARALARDGADDVAAGARLPPSARAEALLNGWLCALACGASADGGSAPPARRERELYEELLQPVRAQPQVGAAVWARLRDLCARAGPSGSLGTHHAAALGLALLHWAALPLSPAAAAAAAAGLHGGALATGAVGGGGAALAGARAVCALLAELPDESSAELQWAVRLSLAYARAAVSAAFDAIVLDVDLPTEPAETADALGGARGRATAPLALAAVMPAALPARLRSWCAALLKPSRVPPPSSATAALVDMARCALRESALAALAAHAGERACAPAAAATGGSDAHAAVAAHVWAALADAADAVDATDDQAHAAVGAQRWAQAAQHCTAYTVWVDSWLGGHALPRGVAGLRALRCALRDALGVGWALSDFALDARTDADEKGDGGGGVGAVLTCAGVAVGARGRVPFRATFQLEAARAGPRAAAGAQPLLESSQPAPLIAMAAISWDVLALGSAASLAPAVADAEVVQPRASTPLFRGGDAAPAPARARLEARTQSTGAHHFKFV